MDRPLLKGFVMKLTHALALSAFVAAAAATLPATAQSYSAPQSASFYSEDHGREARILLGSNTGILPGDVAEIFDGEGKPTGLTFKIFKVQATEARGKLDPNKVMAIDKFAPITVTPQVKVIARRVQVSTSPHSLT